MGRTIRTTAWATVVGLLCAAIGLVVLVAMAWGEVLASPGLSLIDGYWIGRLPWAAVGVLLVVIGATAALLFGAGTSWLAGGLVRRVVSALALGVGLFWWFLAMMPPPRGAFCSDCPPPGPDPITMAYSLPEAALLLLLVPAGAVGAVAVATLRSQRAAEAHPAAS